MSNSTIMMGFLLTKFSDVLELQVFYAITFSIMYVVTLMGNILIVTVTTLDRSLHIAMYFFLRNLSILDVCYIFVTVPNSCVNSLLNSSTISKAGCVVQVFLVVFFVYVELLFLSWPMTVMWLSANLFTTLWSWTLKSASKWLWHPYSVVSFMQVCTLATHSGSPFVNPMLSISFLVIFPLF